MNRPIRNVADLQQAEAAGLDDPLPQSPEDPRRLRQLRRRHGGPGRRGCRAPRPSSRSSSTPSLRTGCIGFCGQEPLLDLMLPGGPRVSYPNMTAGKNPSNCSPAYASSGDLQLKSALGRFDGEEHVPDRRGPQVQARTPPGFGDVPEWTGLDFYRRRKKVILATAARSIR